MCVYVYVNSFKGKIITSLKNTNEVVKEVLQLAISEQNHSGQNLS